MSSSPFSGAEDKPLFPFEAGPLQQEETSLNSPDLFPLRQQFNAKAASEEDQGLVQFWFFRPHLAELLQACRLASVDVLVLKGAALAETLYPRPSLRLFGDIDFLIRASQAEQARAILETLGYIVDSANWEDFVRGRDYQVNFFKHTPRGPVVVELHTHLINNGLFSFQTHPNTEALWERARFVSLAGVPAQVLGLEDQLLHLCLHLAGHYFAAPQSLRDIAQICGHAQDGALPTDWLLFLRLAQETHATAACFCGMYAARSLLGAPVPEEVMQTLSPGSSRKRLEFLVTARAEDIRQTQTDHLRLPLLWYLLGDSRTRLNATRRILFPSRQWLIAHYFYERFDRADAPFLPKSWWRQPLAAVNDTVRFFGTFTALIVIHWGTLMRRGSSVLFR